MTRFSIEPDYIMVTGIKEQFHKNFVWKSEELKKRRRKILFKLAYNGNEMKAN